MEALAEPFWVSRAAALAFHSRQLAEHGGADGVRDEDGLQSALMRPRNKFLYETPDLFDLAAAYAYGIAANHPFVDGNKRTALVVSRTFLRLNGYTVTASQSGKYEAFFRLAAGDLDEAELAGWFRESAKPLTP